MRRAVIAAFLIMTFALPAMAVDYVVGPGDVLKISVYGHQDLETVERVTGTGSISFPLLGQIKVSGFTVIEISNRIANMLADDYIVSPQVTVFVNEFRSRKAVIMGEVIRPGLYELKGNITFLELISMAGGLARDSGSMAIIKRRAPVPGIEGMPEQVITVDLQRLFESGDMSQDVPVVDGDSIFVSKAGKFFVTGEVKKPDSYKYEEGTTVIKAITKAGGFTDKAAPRHVKIIRKLDGVESIYEDVNMDVTINPDDVIVVPESFF